MNDQDDVPGQISNSDIPMGVQVRLGSDAIMDKLDALTAKVDAMQKMLDGINGVVDALGKFVGGAIKTGLEEAKLKAKKA